MGGGMQLRVVLGLVPLIWVGCARSDVGSPCNHGAGFVPDGQAVTFPALSCDHLLCVYAEDVEPPAEGCEQDADCNPDGGSAMVCAGGRCELGQSHVLERSMCSERCEVDADCGGADPDSACNGGFACARIQGLGDHCCEKLCVCRDDLDVAAAADLERTCSAGTTPGCCDVVGDRPEACG